jgi:thioredoxin-dependent peroxiredoxin
MSPAKAKTKTKTKRKPAARSGKAAPKKASSGKPERAKSAAAKPKATAARVALGRKIPDFLLPGTAGGNVRLKDTRGAKLVLYFYPRDNTPGCTLESQQFAALAPQFAAAGTALFGISRDSLASHRKFREHYGLPFDLLSDADELACGLFDVIHEKNMYGRKVIGVQRSTFLIDAAGVLRREWRGVKVAGHAQEVLDAARAL